MLHCTHRHTISLTVYCTLSHFRCLAISFPLSVFMYVSLSLCLYSSQRHQNQHTHTLTHTNPCTHSLRNCWESCMHVINQNDHISLAHKAIFIARNDDTIDFILPRALCGNTLSVGVSNFFLCVCVCVSLPVPPTKHLTLSKNHPRVTRRPTSVCDIQCNTTPHPHATMSQIHRMTRN